MFLNLIAICRTFLFLSAPCNSDVMAVCLPSSYKVAAGGHILVHSAGCTLMATVVLLQGLRCCPVTTFIARGLGLCVTSITITV